MERDSLLAHGASFLLQDRLFLSSDFHIAHVCRTCGSVLSTSIFQSATSLHVAEHSETRRDNKQVLCRYCLEGNTEAANVQGATSKKGKNVTRISLPFVFRYLISELAAMNIRICVDVE
jgi:DNA-directed RNA polymerase I subunit RPA2